MKTLNECIYKAAHEARKRGSVERNVSVKITQNQLNMLSYLYKCRFDKLKKSKFGKLFPKELNCKTMVKFAIYDGVNKGMKKYLRDVRKKFIS